MTWLDTSPDWLETSAPPANRKPVPYTATMVLTCIPPAAVVVRANGGWLKSLPFRIAPNPLPLLSEVKTAGAVGETVAVAVATVCAPEATTTFNEPYWGTVGTTKLICDGDTKNTSAAAPPTVTVIPPSCLG